MAKAYIKAKYAKPAGVYLGIPHRLDRPVSGVVVFARNTKAAQRVHAQFQEHTVRKVYWAAVEGEVSPEAGVWEDWVRKLPEESKAVRAAEGEPGAKLATLEYRVLQRLDGGTLLELTPLTGRMHQLRVQAAWRGHPVLGDVMYGSTAAVRPGGGAPARPGDRAARPPADDPPPVHEGGADVRGAAAGLLAAVGVAAEERWGEAPSSDVVRVPPTRVSHLLRLGLAAQRWLNAARRR